MKLSNVSLLLASAGASAESGSLARNEDISHAKSIAGLRELRKLAAVVVDGDDGEERNLQAIGFGGADCDETCDDAGRCASFLGASPDPSVLEGSCDAGCVPGVALSACALLCGGGDGDAAAATARQRLNLLDFSANLICGNCEFYQCCVSSEASYESCKDNLPDNDSSNGWDLGDMPDMGLLIPDDLDLGDLPIIGSFIPDDWVNDWGAVSSGADGASGLSVLGQLVDSFDCPDACSDGGLCDSVLSGGAGRSILEKACDSGCLPVVSSCASVCDEGAPAAGIARAPAAASACGACKFLACCAEDRGDDGRFDACQELFPDLDELWPGAGVGDHLPDVDWDADHTSVWNHTTEWTYTTEWNYTNNWGASLDWSGIEVALDLSELAESLHSLFDEALADFDTSFTNFDTFPVTCNSETSPIEGLCDLGFELASVNFDYACKNNTFFDVAGGLEEMCTNECDREGRLLSAAFCSLCNVAECCRDGGDASSFEDCALGSVPQEISDAIENIADDLDQLSKNIADAFDQLSEFIEEVVGNASIPEFCPELDGAIDCPVAGFCDVFSGESTNFDLTSFEYEEACNDNTLFLCGPEGFEDMCAEECNSGSDGVLDAAFCSLCNIATCCKNKDDDTTSFEDCAWGSSTQDSTPLSESGGSVGTPGSDSVPEPLGTPIVEFLDSSPQNVAPAESSGSPASTPVEDSPSDSSGGPITPAEDPTSEPLDSDAAIVESSAEVSRSSSPEDPMDSMDSGSYVPKISTFFTLASIATLVLSLSRLL